MLTFISVIGLLGFTFFYCLKTSRYEPEAVDCATGIANARAVGKTASGSNAISRLDGTVQ
jgi:hypothetical protein